MIDIEVKIQILKNNLSFFESYREYDWYCQKRIKEIEQEIAHLNSILDKRNLAP